MEKKLYKLLIVDDEFLVRELLDKTINWNEIGIELVGKAGCAAEVYDFLDENEVDIILTDINMPVVDGVTMSKVIKQQHSKIKIIILTGYDQFEYAKNSIKIGIDDYILKPINEDEITTAVNKVISKLEQEAKKEYEFETLKIQLQENMPYLKEKFLLDILQSNQTNIDIKEKGKFFGIEFQSSFYQVGSVQLMIPTDYPYLEEERLIKLFQIRSIVEQNFRDCQAVQILLDGQERIVVISYNAKLNMLEELKYLLKTFKQYVDWDVAIGIGEVKNSINSIRKSYEEALIALQYKTIMGNNLVIHYNDIGIFSENNSEFPVIEDNELNQLQFLIKAGLKDNVLACVEDLYHKMSEYGCSEEKSYIGYMRVQTTRIISALYYMVSSMNITLSDITYDNDIFDKVHTLCTIPEAKQHVIQLVEKIVEYISNLQSNKVDDFIKNIEEYIHERIGDHGLTLKGTADHFYMNSSYLSRIYKQKKGISFKEYVNKVRMEKAISLLRETELKVYEIGEKVGIPDPNYFSACFKKYMNMSISDYKKTILC